jgi:outer membrane translocation and assembly module TamA
VEQIPGALESIAGNRRQMAFTLGWDSRNDIDWPRRGQLAELRWESAGNDGIIGGLGGDKSYDLVEASFTNYLALNRKQHLALRLKAGHSDDNLPLDKWFFLGGPGSLRGYDYKEFYGNRYFMGNLDYYFEFTNDFAIALFGDIGKAGFSEAQYDDFDYKSDIGIGLAFRDAFRLDIAQRLDSSDASPVVMARTLISF